MTTETSDFVFFVYDGNDYDAMVVRNITQEAILEVSMDLENAGYSTNGCVQLSREQTHFKDTHIVQPKKFVVWINDGGDGNYKFLHDLKVFVPLSQIEPSGLPTHTTDGGGV